MTSGTGHCVRCGESTASDRLVVFNPADDPLPVYECAGCGAVVRVGGREW
ncbi:hypothetical protein [Halorubrum lipolyticum]|nr:hypothetical protein [Halorubrum lipolyticum]